MRFDSAAFSSESKSLSNTPLEPLPYFLGMANGRTQRGALLEFGHFENDLGRRVKARRFTYFFGQTWTVCLRKRVRRGICLAPCPNPPPPRRRRPSSSIGDRGGLLGWKKDEWRKQAVGVSLLPPEKRPRKKNDDEEEEDWDMTLNTYKAWAGLYFFGPLGHRQSLKIFAAPTFSKYPNCARKTQAESLCKPFGRKTGAKHTPSAESSAKTRHQGIRREGANSIWPL